MSDPSSRSWAEIDLDAIRSNARLCRSLSGGRRIMAVVKANAYGHGLAPVVHALEPEVDMLGVAGLHEALEVRAAGVSKPIFLLGASLGGEIPGIVAAEGLVGSLSSLAEARVFSAEAIRQEREVAVHAVVDTGMGRIGFLPENWTAEVAEELANLPGLKLCGVASHLPSADEDKAFTRAQISKFREVTATVRDLEMHIANSAGVIGFSSLEIGDVVRPGLMLYGISPLPDAVEGLRPAMVLKSRITLVRDLPAGSTISYGGTYQCSKATRVATVAIGYGDGYPRNLSGMGAEVEIVGRRCPVLGRVTMDQIMIDVSGLATGPEPGTEAILFGGGVTGIGVEELAGLSGTIPWEIFTGITPRVRRVYVGDETPTETS